MVYVPSIVIEELDNIQIEDEISSRSAAFEKMVRNCRVGRQIKKSGSGKRKKSFSLLEGL